MKVVELLARKPLPADLPGKLRALAADVEAGTVSQMVVVYVSDDSYEFMWPSSLDNSLILTTLAQNRAVERFRD